MVVLVEIVATIDFNPNSSVIDEIASCSYMERG